MAESIVIVGLGAFTSIGINAIENASSALSGLSGKAATEIYNREYEPITVGYIPEDVFPPLSSEIEADIEQPLTNVQMRILRLAAVALDEVWDVIPPGHHPKLIWAAPRLDSSCPPVVTSTFLSKLRTQTGGVLQVEDSEVIATGRAAFFAAMKQAVEFLLRTRQARYVIVGGADSYIDILRLEKLETEGRLPKRGGSDSFVPGEGAAFVALTTERIAKEDGQTPLARLNAVSTGFEEGHRYSPQPYKGEGLAKTMSALFGDTQLPAPISTVFAGFNGESFGAKEWGVSYIRNRDYFADSLQLEHPAEYTGDLGAALAPMMTVVAASSLFDEHISEHVLVFGSSDGGERGALILSAFHGKT